MRNTAPSHAAYDAAFPITLTLELRFLASQCQAQAEGEHRAQDRAFVETLAVRLIELGGSETTGTAMVLRHEAGRLQEEELPDFLRLCAASLRHGARTLEGKNRRVAA